MTDSATFFDEPTKTPFDRIRECLDAYKEANPTDGIDRVAERETALEALCHVLCNNFLAAEASAKDDVFSLGFKVTFDRTEHPTAIKAVSSCSRISKTDIELVCPAEED